MLSIFALVLLCKNVAVAQERQPETEGQDISAYPELNLNEDKTLLIEVEAKQPKTASSVRETIVPASSAKKADQQVKPNEKDPLSFNFLYFIIQRFKFSDIVDR
ncbi:MAG: hypothetical protein JST43_11555 [Bacteroidetes bacterium]|nr:hypothetical protein [Bacteroidota bacterium]MBS1539142.1 hypothetical protein [Bacteroidota bacterium]